MLLCRRMLLVLLKNNFSTFICKSDETNQISINYFYSIIFCATLFLLLTKYVPLETWNTIMEYERKLIFWNTFMMEFLFEKVTVLLVCSKVEIIYRREKNASYKLTNCCAYSVRENILKYTSRYMCMVLWMKPQLDSCIIKNSN